ncbi:MAG TPA: alpha/beta fold hydrolase [Jatrophihabitantaceae bacterium]|nr:alpha/beta fold hydrolase [Jatrophihabitantaceae bacterium]
MPASTRVELTTSDGVVLSALHWDSGIRDLGCVVAHGFTGSASKPHVRAVCVALRERGFGVLAPDMRGHGRSGGLCTAGADERLDVAAAVDWLRARGYQRVAVLGWSMGGSAVLRYAGLGGAADAVVSVSSPGRWFERGTRPMRIVHWMCETGTGRVATRLVRRTRIAGAAWDARLPEAPAEVAGLIPPTPLLIVHGDADHYFPVGHFEALAEAAPEADHWLEPGMGHAETATTSELLARIADWLAAAVRTGPSGVCDDGSRE